jgi:hypothetical protein
MRVKGVKVTEGILIPYQDGLERIADDQVILDIEFVSTVVEEPDYTALDELIGLCETGEATASTQHDQRIYRRRPKNAL